jgi:hypothetical protein
VEFDSGRQILFFKQNQMVSLSVEFLLEKNFKSVYQRRVQIHDLFVPHFWAMVRDSFEGRCRAEMQTPRLTYDAR